MATRVVRERLVKRAAAAVICVHKSKLSTSRILSLNQPVPSEPKDIFSSWSSPSDIKQSLGPAKVFVVELSAITRMIADHLIIYETMNNILNRKRLHFLNYAHKPSSTEKSTNLRSVSVLSVNESFLNSLPIHLIDQAHDGISTSYFPITQDLYRKYIQHVSSIPESGIILGGHRVGSFKRYKDQLQHFTSKLNKDLLKYFSSQKLNSTNDETKYPTTTNYYSGISEILMSSYALPDVKTFNILIREFNRLKLGVPARIVFDALLLSNLPLNKFVYTTALKLAISTSDKQLFMKLARIINLNSIYIPDGEDDPLTDEFYQRFHPNAMSSYKAIEWSPPTEEEKELRRRFFSTPMDDSVEEEFATSGPSLQLGTEGLPSVKLYTTLLSGFVRFGYHWWVDLVLRKQVGEGFPLTLETLTLNMSVAISTKDPVRARWTWNEILKLPIPLELSEMLVDRYGLSYKSVPFDDELYYTCLRAAEVVNDSSLEKSVIDYYREFQYYKVNQQIEKHKLLNKKKSKSIFSFTSNVEFNETLNKSEPPVLSQQEFAWFNSRPRTILPSYLKNPIALLNGGKLEWSSPEHPAEFSSNHRDIKQKNPPNTNKGQNWYIEL